MSTDHKTFYDNTRVKSGKDFREYLTLSLKPIELRYESNYEVCICRYCVPGRCDTYSFTWERGSPSKVAYFSDGWQSMVESAQMVKRDLDKKNVVEMFVQAFSDEKICLYYRRDLLNLLGVLGPQSKTIKALEKQIKKTLTARAKRLVEDGTLTQERADRVLQFI